MMINIYLEVAKEVEKLVTKEGMKFRDALKLVKEMYKERLKNGY